MLLAAASFLGWHAWDGFRTTSDLIAPDSLETSRNLAELFRCTDERVQEAVERGETVAIDPALEDELWQQRLAELVFPRGRLVEDPAAADVVLSVRGDDGPGSCLGVGLVVERMQP